MFLSPKIQHACYTTIWQFFEKSEPPKVDLQHHKVETSKAIKVCKMFKKNLFKFRHCFNNATQSSRFFFYNLHHHLAFLLNYYYGAMMASGKYLCCVFKKSFPSSTTWKCIMKNYFQLKLPSSYVLIEYDYITEPEDILLIIQQTQRNRFISIWKFNFEFNLFQIDKLLKLIFAT
jgi:hypothetical protein